MALTMSQYRLGRGVGDYMCVIDYDCGWLVCNVYGSGALPYVVMYLDGQLNITAFRIISSEFSLYDLEPDFINS